MPATDITNLLLHMEWADATMWRALVSAPPLAHERAIMERVHHFHSTQWAYLQILRGLPVQIPELGGFPDLGSVGRWARQFYKELPAYRGALDDRALARQVAFPWAAEIAERLGSAEPATVGECLLQLVLHTAHHRGQVLTRLREAGGEPPLTDFIAWIWMRRPAPEWEASSRIDTVMWLTLARIVAFVLTVALWRWSLQLPPSPLVNVVCIVLTVSAVFPAVWAGRRLLDADPTVERAARVTTVVHAALMMLFGMAIVKAVQTGDTWRGLVLPVPPRVGTVLVCVTGAVTLLTVVNLALRGLGAPFSIALSRRLATDWLYARTRNPMVLAVLACLIAIGLKLQSALFVVWVGALVAPAWIVFLKIYEERELEIRFGEAYRAYRDRTPFLWPAGSRTS